MTTEPTTTEAKMSNGTTQHTPADVRELAVEIIRSLDLIARNYDSYEYGLPVMTHYDEMVDTVVALLRTPSGEGEAWCAFLDALDGFEEAVANLWDDPEGPTAADMERLRQSRQRVIECARALAALRSEAQGEEADALDLLRWAESHGVALEPVAGNVMPPGTYACYVEGVGDDPAEYEDAGEPYMGPGILGAIRAARQGEGGGE